MPEGGSTGIAAGNRWQQSAARDEVEVLVGVGVLVRLDIGEGVVGLDAGVGVEG
jgi:hypothetical protein